LLAVTRARTRGEEKKEKEATSVRHGGSDYEAEVSRSGGDGSGTEEANGRDELPGKQLPVSESQRVDVDIAAGHAQGTRLSVAGNT